MPYIKSKDRTRVIVDGPDSVGELNFYISTLVANYLKRKGLSYQALNDVVGALEGAKLEFYRRVVKPYEDKKLKENGDVY